MRLDYSRIKTIMTFKPTLILPGIYLSHKPNKNDIQDTTIQRIVSIGGGKPLLKGRHYGISDHKSMLHIFDDAVDYIHSEHSKKHNILIHCLGGIRRSPTILAAYLIKYKQHSPQQAIQYIKSKHPRTNPGDHQLKDLHDFYQQLRQRRTFT
jgi:hypothetical protein